MGTIENEAAVREALAHYVAGMRGLRLPAELGELLAVHGTCEEDALRLFVQRSFKDEGYTYQKRLMEAIKESYRRSLGQNEAASKDSCRALLETLSAAMQRSQGESPEPAQAAWSFRSLSVATGRDLPRERVGIGRLSARRQFRAACYAISSSPAEEGLEQFLASKRIEAETVLNVDKNLTEAEKDLASKS
ncbi:unnamed protein product [Caretta caretta]